MSHYELVLDLTLDAPKEKLFRCWTDPDLLKQWFAPKPWTISKTDHDWRPGGRANIVMRSPEGQEFPSEGVFLEIAPNRKIVTTDAFTEGWQPAGRPFMVAEVTFEDAGEGKTHYRAVARHWNEETLKEHEKMGFHQGWTICARQLEALAKTI
jgi:uncharacterized protein YndB with AHSA1/START domain